MLHFRQKMRQKNRPRASLRSYNINFMIKVIQHLFHISILPCTNHVDFNSFTEDKL